jgi:hypothetical protein
VTAPREVPSVHLSLTVYVGWTEQHGLTVRCRECSGLGPLGRPGEPLSLNHLAGCSLAHKH